MEHHNSDVDGADLIANFLSARNQLIGMNRSFAYGDYYHPNSYAFYGGDPGHLSFATCRWHADNQTAFRTSAVLASGTVVSHDDDAGARTVKFSDGATIQFTHSRKDGPGDGTVPQQSGIGPAKGVKQIFRTIGYDHQGSYNNESMILLTLQLIARIAQDAK